MSAFAARFIIAVAMAATGFAFAPTADAVQRDPGGQGQVLIYPYYTVTQYANGQRSKQTLLSIINTSNSGQVVQVTFREALNGRAALQFKLWLGQWDVWTGTVFALVDDGIASDGVAVLTRDRSCTTPMFSTSGLTTSGGTPYLPFGTASYSGAKSDGGPSDLLRARHGWIEIISLANVTGPSVAAINPGPNGGPANCAAVQNLAYGPDVSTRPSGGLVGTVSIISVAEGTVLSSIAEALSGFTGLSLYSNDPVQPAPNLSSVNEGMPGGAVSAMVVDELGRNQLLTYGVPGSGSRPIDAVSAVLMATRVKNEHQSDYSIGGITDWVLTLPTKPFYTDPALIGATDIALPPFDEAFVAPGSARQCVPYSLVSQEQRQYSPVTDICSLDPTPPIPPFGGPSRPLVVRLFQAANVIPFLNVTVSPTSTGVLAAPRPPAATSPYADWFIRPAISAAGWLDFNLAATNFNHRLPASSEGKILSGLPAIGYSASLIINANATSGVLANYGSAVRHVTTVSCSKASDGLPCD